MSVLQELAVARGEEAQAGATLQAAEDIRDRAYQRYLDAKRPLRQIEVAEEKEWSKAHSHRSARGHLEKVLEVDFNLVGKDIAAAHERLDRAELDLAEAADVCERATAAVTVVEAELGLERYEVMRAELVARLEFHDKMADAHEEAAELLAKERLTAEKRFEKAQKKHAKAVEAVEAAQAELSSAGERAAGLLASA